MSDRLLDSIISEYKSFNTASSNSKPTPLGIRNNNPGNIRASATSFKKFETPEEGLTAAAKNLIAYKDKYGIDTVDGIINRWAPPSDNNNTSAYVAAVSQKLGVDPKQKLDVKNPQVLSQLVSAITQHENGMNPYDDKLIGRAAENALSYKVASNANVAPPSAVQENNQDQFLDEIISEYKNKQKSPAKKEPNVFADVGKSALQGLREGVSLPYDLASMATTAVANKVLGVEKDFQTPAPTVTDAMKNAGLNYEPQTTAGEYARTATSFAPFGMIGKAPVAAKVIRQVLAPAIASETAGQMTKGSEYEPLARMAGGIVGGVAASKPATDAMMKAAIPVGDAATSAAMATGRAIGGAAKSVGDDVAAAGLGASARKVDALDDAMNAMYAKSNSAYQSMKANNAYLNERAAGDISRSVVNALKDAGKINKNLHVDTLSVLKDFAADVSSGPISIEEIDQYRRLFSAVAKQGHLRPEDAMRSTKIIHALDDFVAGIKPQDLSNGTPKAVEALTAGRAGYAQASKFEQIVDVLKKADGSPVKLKKLLYDLSNNDRKLKGFTASEVNAIMDAAKYSGTENVLKLLGKFGIEIGGHGQGNVVMPTMLGAGLGATLGSPVGIATVAGGTLARAGQKAIARGKAEKILQAIEGRAPKGKAPNAEDLKSIPRITINPKK